MGDVEEVTIEATLTFRLRLSPGTKPESYVRFLEQQVGTFMIDTEDWRFKQLDPADREAIVEIYAEVY